MATSEFQDQFDEAMLAFSRGDYEEAATRLKAVLAQDAAHFDAQLALGMTYYRQGDYTSAIAEGHRAEKLKPHEQLVHTNLSLFYMKAGDKAAAEHHGLQARISSWRTESKEAETNQNPAGNPELELAKPKPRTIRLPGKFPDMPWKKKPAVAQQTEDPGSGSTPKPETNDSKVEPG